MRTTVITLLGEERILCCSTRFIRDCSERYGAVDGIEQALTGAQSKVLDEAMWLLAGLMDAGDRWAKLNGKDNPDPLTADQLLDLFGMDDLKDVVKNIKTAISAGNETTVKVASKNAEAAPEET